MCFLVVTQSSYNRLPEHCVPSPAKPGLHAQVWEPKVLAQLAFLSHLCFLVLHSSISEDRNVCVILAHSGILLCLVCLRCQVFCRNLEALVKQWCFYTRA